MLGERYVSNFWCVIQLPGIFVMKLAGWLVGRQVISLLCTVAVDHARAPLLLISPFLRVVMMICVFVPSFYLVDDEIIIAYGFVTGLRKINLEEWEEMGMFR